MHFFPASSISVAADAPSDGTVHVRILNVAHAWGDTGIDLSAGRAVTIVAEGKATVNLPRAFPKREATVVGPEGTYDYADDVADKAFPLPAADGGPAPCYALIGRIGDGPPFVIGRQKSWIPDRDGRLYLGINDFDVGDNRGEFRARISTSPTVEPVRFEQTLDTIDGPGRPLNGCHVVVFYVDGLRPDVVREMAALGHIPNIRSLFLDGGTWMSNAFTAFPSDTITSNGTMWTGCFSDRHGLKGQVRFSRRSLVCESYLDPLGPSRSARLLKPQGIDRLVQSAETATIAAVKGAEEGESWRASQTTDIPPIYAHLRANGTDWATGVLPMMTDVPPLLWTRSMTRQMPYFHSQEGWKHIDNANTDYATHYLLSRNSPVTIVWLPETDSVSHKQSRGQFGATRRTIVEADRLIGSMLKEIEAQRRLATTYFFLVSDHGHHGGQTSHLTHFDIANDWLFRPREVTPAGEWVGGGLGMSVRQHRHWNRHQGDASREFVFIDANSDGVARIFLPRQHYRSHDWTGPSRPADLLAYKIDEQRPPVDLVRSLTATRTLDGTGRPSRPVDLVLMKLDDKSLLISTHDRGQAVIDRKRDEHDRWVYRYTPVTDVAPADDGSVAFRVVENPRVDPLGLLQHYFPEVLHYYHDEREWLKATIPTPYPDSVVALSRHMLWQENLKVREAEYAPDLVVTARPGWYFGTESSPGTMHGYPFHDAMRASWFVSGPNVRRGARVAEPCRLVDLTPTILEMVGFEIPDGEFDGLPIRAIYESSADDDGQAATQPQPVYWNDVDLGAWDSLRYAPLPKSRHMPISVNRPDSPFDVNNVVYNVLTITELSVFRLFDDVVSPLSGGKQYVLGGVERAESFVRHSKHEWAAEGAQALNVSGIALGDYNWTSLGNLKRADGVVDWIQKRALEIDRTVAKPLGKQNTAGNRVVQKTVDTTQFAFWELYRFVQRVIVEVIDEKLLNGLEDGTDRTVNKFREIPAEKLVPSPEASP